jgi:hypothetical protein
MTIASRPQPGNQCEDVSWHREADDQIHICPRPD